VGPRTNLDDMEWREILTLPGLELRPLDRPAPRQLLYRLSYPRSDLCNTKLKRTTEMRFLVDRLVFFIVAGMQFLFVKRPVRCKTRITAENRASDLTCSFFYS
jgi:hypothetical protein